ncbi:multidrug efflux RND transporter permease subunit [Mesorhizobium sp. CGMCC 1.15528]|uniref:Efflux pump membrane transporter n=1 Tax=Mesorhizobium zhangyense TaxID=1776730 RepID=A0A7C9R971_9HYPH|nr:efflux RND transporter permease subunit [Mesorhizobium zhangyense]NGN43135.1 multidrug efflux RND transporter permease subunit [Mesorhizobium zhangyense]
MNHRFFIDRPVFAAVISIVIVLAGVVAMRVLPIAQYPELTPPQVVVSATYPGASAEVLTQTVAAPLEEQINGVENMLYMQSINSGSGTMRLIVTFATGTDADQATINVNNRVQRAVSSLPQEVQRLGVLVNKQSSSILAVISLNSSNAQYDSVYLANYALLNVIDELKRTPGVGDSNLFSRENYSMRVWLRPDKLAQYNLTTTDVATAITEQNAQYSAGRVGDPPTQGKLSYSYAVTTDGRLPDAEAFGNIILRADENAATLRLKDVARIELGAQDYSFRAIQAGKPTVPIGIYLQPGANALNTMAAVEARLDELATRFPDGVTYEIPYDTTLFVQESINEVIKTFIEALVLVVVVVFVFLQNWRATLIPLIAVPVSILGTFAGMYMLGFSINMLTLFGLVLAIGIVVDDAIVVLENVERIMTTEKLPPREAAIKAMGEVTGPVIAIVLVLVSVFVPVAFMGGLAGEMYRQFAITIAVSVTLSGVVALTLTPALCAILLKPGHHEPWAPFRWFNRAFDWLTSAYTAGVRFFLKRALLALTLFAIMVGAMAHLFNTVPSALVPNEDQGVILAVGILPPAASLARTSEVMSTVSDNVMKNPAVENVLAFSGYDLLAGSQSPSAGAAFIKLKDWSERKAPELDARVLPGAVMGMNAGIQDGMVLAFNPPPIQGLSTTGGFELYVQDRTGAGAQALMNATQQIVTAAAEHPELANVRTTMSMNVPQYKIDVDREKATALGVPLSSVFSTMQATFGSVYVNDFTLYGRNFQVKLQSEANFREKPEDLSQIFVRSQTSSAMIPLDSLVTVKRVIGPDLLERFNNFPAAKIMGDPAPGYSSGQALQAIQKVAATALPEGYTVAWTGTAYQEIETGGTGMQALLFGIVMVFLILAAQYERWSLPLAVILAVPFALFGALVAIWLRGLSNDVYFQIGLVTLIGLAAKNAILIVEFAVLKRQEGLSAFDAALEAARLRFRPIIMTSLAFILGVLPLAISTGAGSASRHSIGTGVIGGMLAATFLAIFLIPLFFKLIGGRDKRRVDAPQPVGGHEAGASIQ